MELFISLVGVVVVLVCLEPLARAYRRQNETGEETIARRKRETLQKINAQQMRAYEVDESQWWI